MSEIRMGEGISQRVTRGLLVLYALAMTALGVAACFGCGEGLAKADTAAYREAICAELAVAGLNDATPLPTPDDAPRPQPGVCDNCNGTGRSGDGLAPCRVCGGDGRIESGETLAEPLTADGHVQADSVVDVSDMLLAYSPPAERSDGCQCGPDCDCGCGYAPVNVAGVWYVSHRGRTLLYDSARWVDAGGESVMQEQWQCENGVCRLVPAPTRRIAPLQRLPVQRLAPPASDAPSLRSRPILRGRFLPRRCAGC